MATKKQDRMYAHLRLSSEFSADEVAEWDVMLADSHTPIAQASDLIDTMLRRIANHNQRIADALMRKAEFYAKKGS